MPAADSLSASALAASRAAAAVPIVAQPDDRELAAGVLARGFAADPVCDWFLRAGAGHDAARLRMMRQILSDRVLSLGETFLAGDGGACSVWLTPPVVAADLSLADRLERAWRVLPISGPARYGRVMRLIAAMDTHHPHDTPHYYLWFLAVDPAHQGHGVGSALLDANLRRYDALGVPTYLENSNPRNTPFYTRHGYRSRGEFRAAPDAPPLLGMWRNVGGK